MMSYLDLALKLLHLRANGPKVSIHRNPFVFAIFLMVLLAALPLIGCVGLTSAKSPASSTDPAQVIPSITTQPTSQTVTVGQLATFSVRCTGEAPLSYQWRKNGTAISGATSASYTIPVTTISDSGIPFTVAVSNSTGSVTSNTVTLTVNAAALAPSITTQPTSQTVTADQTATFSVAASGAAPLSYQWRKSGTAISGATSASYTIPLTRISDSGIPFTVAVSNSTGSVTSNPVTLTVNAAALAPSITTQPASQTVTVGQTATYSVTTSGTSPLNYQWRKNGTVITGATSATYTTPVTAMSDDGSQFTVMVTNSTSSVTSKAATLTITAVPAGQLIASVSSVNFNNVNIGRDSAIAVTFTNSGNSNITISNVSISGPGFNTSGVSTGLVLTRGQTTISNVTFAPVAAGNMIGSLTVTSNASNSPTSITLSGMGVHQNSPASLYGVPWNADGLANLEVGKWGEKVSYRFRAEKSGPVKSILVFVKDNAPGYFGGDGGQLLVELQADDGTEQHLPSGTVLAQSAVLANLLPPSPFNRTLSFTTQPKLVQGTLYHLVFINPANNPLNNYVSIDDLYNAAGTPNMQPGYSDIDLAVLRTYASSPWSVDYFHTPILSLNFADGTSQGQGYINTLNSTPSLISGNAEVREIFSVTGDNKATSKVSVRMRTLGNPGDLTVLLETRYGSLIEQGKISASTVHATNTWITYVFNTSHTLIAGLSYDLVLSAPPGDSYQICLIEKGSPYGFNPPTVFGDGHYQTNIGSGWIDFQNRPDFDMQFYFTLEDP